MITRLVRNLTREVKPVVESIKVKIDGKPVKYSEITKEMIIPPGCKVKYYNQIESSICGIDRYKEIKTNDSK